MIIRCCGARGSMLVSGEIYNRYGVDATCIEIRTGNDEVILDAGSGIRRAMPSWTRGIFTPLFCLNVVRCRLANTRHAVWLDGGGTYRQQARILTSKGTQR